MTAREIDDMLFAQRRLMWALPPAQREHQLTEVRADYEYESQLEAVAAEMALKPDDDSGDATGAMALVVLVDLFVLLAIGTVLFQVFR